MKDNLRKQIDSIGIALLHAIKHRDDGTIPDNVLILAEAQYNIMKSAIAVPYVEAYLAEDEVERELN
jgi:hypothetical protein